MQSAAYDIFADLDIDAAPAPLPPLPARTLALLSPGDEILTVPDPPEVVSFGSQTAKLPLPSWPPMLTFELALGLDSLDTILNKYGVSDVEYEYLSRFPAFRKDLAAHRSTIEKDGLTFRAKARVQAEAYLEELHEIVTDSSNPASTRLDAIKYVTKCGDLEPKESKGSDTSGASFNIQINF